jgi:hypothetical protein
METPYILNPIVPLKRSEDLETSKFCHECRHLTEHHDDEGCKIVSWRTERKCSCPQKKVSK